MLLECAMLCFICPTASAAGVITDRLGGNLHGTVTYLLLSNTAATLPTSRTAWRLNCSLRRCCSFRVGWVCLPVYCFFTIFLPPSARLAPRGLCRTGCRPPVFQ